MYVSSSRRAPRKVAELHQGGFDRYDGPARLTSLTKVYWPDEGYTKGDLLAYYYETADFVVPWLDGYPLSLNRHPDGIAGEGFYHKDQQGYVPPNYGQPQPPPVLDVEDRLSEGRGARANPNLPNAIKQLNPLQKALRDNQNAE